MSADLRRKLNLFYYNIFRFERFTQYLISNPINGVMKLIGLGSIISQRSGRQDWDEYILGILNNPKGGMSLNFAGMHVSLLIFLSLTTLWNLFCGFFRLDLDTVWVYGLIFLCVIGFVMSFYIAPIGRKHYLKDFKKFESRPRAEKRRNAIITFFIEIGIWGMFVLSMAFYMRSALAH